MRNALSIIAMALISVVQFGCNATQAETDPYTALKSSSLTGYQHSKAIETLDATAPNDPETLKALHEVVRRDNYLVHIREEALNRLAERDLDNLKRTIRQSLPRSESWGWVTRCSEIIAERGWIDLSPALVSSWARQVLDAKDDTKRPEYKALAHLHGADHVTETVFTMFIQTNSVGEQGLRTRCWNLLHRLGQRERLVQLLASSEIPADDAMLIDLRAGATDLGLVPVNREEILWLRQLRTPEHAEFWTRAKNAVANLSAARRAELELRDLPILVSATLHHPELVNADFNTLYARVDGYLHTQPHHVQDSNYDSIGSNSRQRLNESRDKLTWGDLAAIDIAIRAIQIPEVIRHLFNYADRDQVDTSTEYGGIIALDGKDRIEVLEFQPVMRRHDQEFIASQAMLDAAYTSIFHFHLHAQNPKNDKYAGPGFGDLNYADNTRANCLVFTFMNKDTLNVDYYRYDRVVVDLGVIKRPDTSSASRESQAAPDHGKDNHPALLVMGLN